jgi:tetratricopeptide (TPR) repeat protein
MRKRHALAILIVSVCAAQTNSPSPSDIAAADAALKADLRGTEDAEASPQLDGAIVSRHPPIQIQPPKSPTDRPSARSVSVAQLRHKPPRNAQKAVGRGARFSKAGDHRRAAEEFERAIAEDTEFANGYDRLGVEYAQLGRYGEAEAELRRSLALDPASWAGHYDLGVVLYRLGDFPAAERSVRRALELSKANAQVHLLLGLLLWRRVETRGARSVPEAKELLTNLQEK